MMAIFSLHSRVIGRSKGHNIIKKMAYFRAACLNDEQLNIKYNYSKRNIQIYTELSFPDCSFNWIKELETLSYSNQNLASEKLWNIIEKMEKRKDSQLAREVRISLPIELNEKQNIVLIHEYVKHQFTSSGMIADWSIHFHKENPNAHIFLTYRKIDKNGFGMKAREWNKISNNNKWREQWAKHANIFLEKYGHNARIDHRSYAAQGVKLVPTIHLGKSVIEQKKRGIKTDRMQAYLDILKKNELQDNILRNTVK